MALSPGWVLHSNIAGDKNLCVASQVVPLLQPPTGNGFLCHVMQKSRWVVWLWVCLDSGSQLMSSLLIFLCLSSFALHQMSALFSGGLSPCLRFRLCRKGLTSSSHSSQSLRLTCNWARLVWLESHATSDPVTVACAWIVFCLDLGRVTPPVTWLWILNPRHMAWEQGICRSQNRSKYMT